MLDQGYDEDTIESVEKIFRRYGAPGLHEFFKRLLNSEVRHVRQYCQGPPHYLEAMEKAIEISVQELATAAFLDLHLEAGDVN